MGRRFLYAVCLIVEPQRNRELAEGVWKEWLDSRMTRVDLRDRWIGRATEQERNDKQLPKEALDIMVDEEDCRLVTGADRESMKKDCEEVMEHL